MKKNITLYFLCALASFLATTPLSGQVDCSTLIGGTYSVCDQFSDGNIGTNPTWSGDVAQFMVNANGQLQLNSAGTDIAALSTQLSDNVMPQEWQVSFSMEFSPSGSNQLRIYLLADQANLETDLNGYYLLMGETGASDAIELYRQNGATSTLLVRGTEATVAANPAIHLKITRSATGEWQIFTAPFGGGTYTLDAQITDNTIAFPATTFFGVNCKHTSTNATKFYFDNVYVGDSFVDNIPPQPLTATFIDPTHIDVLFSEAIEISSAETASNYTILGQGSPSLAVLDPANPALVHLTFDAPFAAGTNTLQITAVADLALNTMFVEILTFDYVVISAGSIVINELLTDEDPQVGLPAAEFIELYNNTNFAAELNGWRITKEYPDDLGATIPTVTIPANGFLILCKTTAVADYQAFGTAVGVTSIPTLNNTGNTISLTDNAGNLMSQVAYLDDWIIDATKRQGGWSLEQINPEAACSSAQNWRESENPAGGTPGTQNSLFGTGTDTQAPQFVGVALIDNHTVKLTFDESLDAIQAANPANYTIDQGASIASVVANADTVVINFTNDLTEGLIYNLNINNLSDCLGNISMPFNVSIAAAEPALPHDVLITEVYADTDAPESIELPEPHLPPAKYIELFNKSQKTISLSGWTIADAADTAYISNYLLLPNQYVVLCNSSVAALLQATGIAVLPVPSMPDINTTGDLVWVANANGILIHGISFDKSWYKDPARDEGGWSLEMIDINNVCEGYANWQACQLAYGGTPAAQNSVAGVNPDTTIPDLLHAEAVAPDSLILYFSEPVNRTASANVANYSIDFNVGNPQSAEAIGPDFRRVLLVLSTSLQAGNTYLLSIGENLTDCAGNNIGIYDEAKVGIGQKAEPGDLVINEILPNPGTDGYDFVEIYNRSNKNIQLQGWYWANADVTHNADVFDEYTPLVSEPFTLFAGEYLAVTENPGQVISFYTDCGREVPPTRVVQSDLPSLNDDEGVIAIADLAHEDTIDRVHYYDKWHYQLLDVLDGVSLERIDYTKPSQDPANWQSAASAFCYATPGYKNSQLFLNGQTTDNDLAVLPKTFSPDQDGYNDFTIVSYQLDNIGYTIDLLIYDERGREVRHLAKNDIGALEGTYKWDGTTEAGEKVQPGIYVIRAQAFDPANGNTKTFKATCVVAGKID